MRVGLTIAAAVFGLAACGPSYPTISPEASEDLVFTPAGDAVVFTTLGPRALPTSTSAALYVYDLPRGRARLLHETRHGYWPPLAVAGGFAYFVEQISEAPGGPVKPNPADTPRFAIRRASLAGDAVETLAEDLGHPFTLTVASDGARAFFSSDGRLQAVGPGGGTPAVIAAGFPIATSPDGRQLVVAPADPIFTKQFQLLTLETGATEPLSWTTDETYSFLNRKWRWTEEGLAVFTLGGGPFYGPIVLRHEPITGTTTRLLASTSYGVDVRGEGWRFGHDYDVTADGRFLHMWRERCSEVERELLGSSCVESQAVLLRIDLTTGTARAIFDRSVRIRDGVSIFSSGPIASSPDGTRVAWSDNTATYLTEAD